MQEKRTNADALLALNFDKQSASERMAQVFLEKIRNGELENGYRMPPQRELAQIFGVGMSTVREALKILNVMGYVNAFHGKGTFVIYPPEARDEFLDIHQALKLISFSDVMVGRRTIECAIVELAAQNAKLDNLDEIRHHISEMETSTKDVEAWYDADLMGFHLALAKASQNQTLLEICKTLIQRVRQEFTPLMKNELDNVSEENLRIAVQTANQVYEHIKARDPKGASFALKEHLSIVLSHERIKKTENLIESNNILSR
jgi:GntR family transcriptional repressor for pyruvate dehydrogenase complex